MRLPSKKLLDALCKLYEKDCTKCDYIYYCTDILESEEMIVKNDFLIGGNEARWIGVWIKIARKWIAILNENVHDWLIPFEDIFLGLWR